MTIPLSFRSVWSMRNAWLLVHFPRFGKWQMFYRFTKKRAYKLKKIYRPISLLPICGKIFEKILFDKIYNHLCDNELLSPNQSGFRPGDSTVNQLIAITHQIHVAFEEYPSREIRAVFLDLSKAFNKVWHDGLLHKLESNGISGLLLNLIRDFLSERQQRVVLNGKNSDWRHISAGVPPPFCFRSIIFLGLY